MTSSNGTEKSELQTNIDAILAEAHAVFQNKHNEPIRQILVNARTTVEFVEARYDFGNSADYFSVTLTLDLGLYSTVAHNLTGFGEAICEAFNEVHQNDHEYVTSVRIKINPETISDWRKETGLLIDGQMNYTHAEAEALWGMGLRIFVSHASEQKDLASELGDFLEKQGMSVFVAHEDIHRTLEWQREIEKALSTMDAFVALLTEEFKSSDWCSQELGFAIARTVPIFPVRAGKDPYGFIGKIQALSAKKRVIRSEIEEKFSDHPRMPATELVKFEIFIKDVDNSPSFLESIGLSRRLTRFESVSVELGDKLAEAVNGNVEAWGSWGFNSKREENGHLNVAEHLTRLTGTDYELNEDRDTRHEWLVRRNTLITPEPSGELNEEDDDDLPW